MKYLTLIITLLGTTFLFGQPFSNNERIQGYSVRKDTAIFIFDPVIYKVDPNKVVVTGSFRNWDQDMKNKEWIMEKKDNIWILNIDNKKFETIKPHDEFKFRINEGQWLNPPIDATNIKGGNLVFMKDTILPGLKAELKGPYTIWAKITGQRPLEQNAYRVTDANGNEIPISGVLPNTSTETLITTERPMDIKRVYFLEIPSIGLKSFCSYDGWFRNLYSNKELGANIHGNKTTIRIFSPRAEHVNIYLYKKRNDTIAYRVENMVRDDFGIWEYVFNEKNMFLMKI